MRIKGPQKLKMKSQGGYENEGNKAYKKFGSANEKSAYGPREP